MNKSIYYDDLCDFKLHKSHKIPFKELKNKPSNSIKILGKPPNGNLEDVKTTQEIINDVDYYKDITKEIKFESNIKCLDSKKIPENIEKFTSLFDFVEKTQVFGIINQTNNEVNNSTIRSSKLMSDFMKSKKKQIPIKKPQDDAPVTISSKHQMTRFNKPEEIIRRYTNFDLQFNIPTNVNLSHIAQFETTSTALENYFNEEHIVNLAPQSAILSDDTSSYQTPIDKLKDQNIKQQNIKQQNINTENINNNNYNEGNKNNDIVYNQIPQTNSQQINKTSTLINIPNNNNQNNNIQNNNFQNNNIQNNNIQNNNIQNIQSKPTVIKNNKTSNVPKAPNAPSIPKPPSIPTIVLPSKENNQGDKTKDNVIEKKDLEKLNAGRGGLLDALKSDNPMGNLKKSGSLVVKQFEPKCKRIFFLFFSQ